MGRARHHCGEGLVGVRPIREILGNSRVRNHRTSLGLEAVDVHLRNGANVLCLFSDDEDGWEHVSVSPKGSKYEKDQPTPTWDAMCQIKSIFWSKEEQVVQIHPPESEYLHGIGGDTNILHLWRPKNGDWSALNSKGRC